MDGALTTSQHGQACWSPLGRALLDYHRGARRARFVVHSDLWEDETTAVEEYYRPLHQDLPELELKALDLCRGRVLDLGAGAGRHALELQSRGLDVVAVDMSPDAAEVMRLRGVRRVRCGGLEAVAGHHFDTVLLLMHGLGIVGTLEGLADFLRDIGDVLAEGGQILCDSADLERALPALRHGSHGVPRGGKVRGWEVTFRLSYEGVTGSPYRWLFIAPRALQRLADRAGFRVEVPAHGGRGAFLARMTRR